MAFRRPFRRMRRKLSTSWIPGLSGLNTAAPAQAKTLALTASPAAANSYGAAIILTTSEDLKLHGGEDCTVQRIRGRLWFYGMTYDANPPAGTWARVVIAQQDVDPAGNILFLDYTTSVGLGDDNILHTEDLYVSSATAPQDGGTDAPNRSTLPLTTRIDIDCKARRRLTEEKQLVFWFQTVKSGTAIPTQVTYAGGLRMLLKRPR